MSFLKPSGKELERFDGLSLIYWTLMGPYGMDRTVYCMEFNNCINGLGIKVIGGLREFSSEEYGVYVKRILPGGVAFSDGRLLPGDQILEVNGESLLGVSNDRAVDILRMASATGYMRLLIARDEEARSGIFSFYECPVSDIQDGRFNLHTTYSSQCSGSVRLPIRYTCSLIGQSYSCDQHWPIREQCTV
ncbi:hypothetical protein GDO78_018420 [Eleutherodactylus coqui]|uniref:PDZ domain-containing protein n=1 Tax=Eleutherodactylus coqui TaxID=57060 RepID=A0A8J6BDT8_ELECQ|nr:hypothetical protein GDO78_018420 [Eleutherodactylus coqui]